MDIQQKKLVVFDLDGTLTESKQPMDAEMASLIARLLEYRLVAIISGGKYEMFEHQLPVLKPTPELLKKLFFFPTTGSCFYRFENGAWKQIYADEMTIQERQKIKDAFEKAYKDIDYHHPPQLFGEVVEDRGTQVTFSALGQMAPLELKKEWKEKHDRRPELMKALEKYLPEFEVKMPGMNSIDVTRKGINKGYGVRQMRDHLGVSIDEMIFIGDALYEGGNDYAVKREGVDCVEVSGPEDTKKLIQQWLGGLHT